MVSEHIVASFDRDLEGIQAKVMRMGGLVEVALRDAVQALEEGDLDAADRIRRDDQAIDRLNEEIRSETAQLLALRAPTAIDLRVVLSVMAISASLERIGDYAKNIAKRSHVVAEGARINGSIGALKRMSHFVIAMISDALDAYIQHDTALASDVFERDREADQMYNTLFRALLTHMMEDHRNITAGMHLHFIAKNIERAGDHATTIAEQTIYMVTGETPDDDRPKGDTTPMHGMEAGD
ncbi:phosphate signaling complex protein PhoU [Aestuariivita sp.]|jgi:phosphate transport system protein|uniref:phosphate signaling complex protein PhoU n=1 Tax=Aestuariivita sp. TaxID=1872407 RepID=UPI00216CA391|nr:phosphate signaling complex protein PhoU [Aestuariivita sp.]MCE8007895.1 phosphate signaling complex protein PhoU [Aestuariivita sp.]